MDPRKPVHVGAAWRVLLRDLGLEPRVVLQRAGLSPSLLDGNGSRVSIDDYYALHAAIDAEHDHATLALEMGNVAASELFDPALFAAMCSPDFNMAVTRLSHFKNLVGAFGLGVEITPTETRVHHHCRYRPDLPMTHGLAELVFLVAFARRATRHALLHARSVTVQQLPTTLAPYEAFFGCPVQQGDVYAFSLAARDASRPFLTHNNSVWEACQPAMQKRIADASEEMSTTQRVERALFQLLPSGRTQISDVAKELGVGARTLQRRLAAEQTTWLELLNNTRERMARHYLKNTAMSPTEVSFLLGFEDPNSLYRAFNRWTGTTPETWRAAGG